ncbi:MAG: hypothetical protein M0Z45_01240 [Actinomycetota bacterium]|nr:hypothetical protein [Actinomycetota bacterium]
MAIRRTNEQLDTRRQHSKVIKEAPDETVSMSTYFNFGAAGVTWLMGILAHGIMRQARDCLSCAFILDIKLFEARDQREFDPFI